MGTFPAFAIATHRNSKAHQISSTCFTVKGPVWLTRHDIKPLQTRLHSDSAHSAGREALTAQTAKRSLQGQQTDCLRARLATAHSAESAIDDTLTTLPNQSLWIYIHLVERGWVAVAAQSVIFAVVKSLSLESEKLFFTRNNLLGMNYVVDVEQILTSLIYSTYRLEGRSSVDIQR